MLVSAGVITAVIAVIAVVWDVTHDEPGPRRSAPITWDALAVVGRAAGDVTLVDRDGRMVAEYKGLGRTARVESAGTHLALIGSTSVTLLDVADADADDAAEPVTIDIPIGSEVTRLPTDRQHLLLAAGKPGNDLVLIDAVTGWSGAVGELSGLRNPRLYADTVRVDPSGSTIAVADAASFQTIVIRRATDEDPEAEPVVENYADQPLAVSDTLVATSQVVGQRADVSVHVAGQPASVPVGSGLPAGGVIVDGALVAVTTDGQVIRIRPGDRSPRELARLDLPDAAVVTDVLPALDGNRLVVTTTGPTLVLDTAGELVFSGTGETPADGVRWEQRCLVIGTDVVDLEDGQPAIEPGIRRVGAELVATSADGCTLLDEFGTRLTLSNPSDEATMRGTGVLAFAPDGRALVTREGTRTDFVVLDESLAAADPIELTVLARSAATSFAFVER